MGSDVAAPAAILLATVPAFDGGPAAALPADGRTLLERLLAQLSDVGVRRAWVVTRPEWAGELATAAAGVDVTVRVAADVAEDLEVVADVAGEAGGRLLIGVADALVHQRPLAVLLADPRVRSGVLVTTPRGRAAQALHVRQSKGRIVGADSAYHRMSHPTGYQLGLAVVDAAHLGELAGAAARMAAVAAGPLPDEWHDQLDANVAAWRAAIAGGRWSEDGVATDAGGPLVDTDTVQEPGAAAADAPVELPAEVEARVAHRTRVAVEDAMPLLVVALVRSGVRLDISYLRAFFHARPLSREGALRALAQLAERDEDRLALDSAVKPSDGFFTTFFVSSYSRFVARFAARRGWTPNALTTASMLIGVLAALAFATGSRGGQVAGALLLQAAFTVDCVDGQLARYTLRFSKLGAWLDSTFDRAKEYVVYAGLAVGASRGFGEDVWALAAAALTLQTFRHMLGFAFDGSRHERLQTLPILPFERAGDEAAGPPAPPASAGSSEHAARGAAVAVAPAPAARTSEAPPREPTAPAPAAAAATARVPLALRPIHAVGRLDRFRPMRWVRRIWLLPIGERFALISITAALFTPRTTFVALLAWGGATAIWGVTGRVLRSLAS